LTRKSIIINYKHIRKPLTLQDKYRNKRKLKKLVQRWKPIAIIVLMALIIGIASVLVNLPEKRMSGEEIKIIESNIIYAIAPLETKITPKEEIIIPKVINDTPKKKSKPVVVKIKVITIPQSDIQKQVQSIANEYGWGTGEQWEALSWIIQKESGWRVDAQNPTSTAFGLFQHLDQTRKNYGCPKTNDIRIQTECGIKYIKARYKTATGARQFWNQNKWY
jgi:hypothetical protein